MFETEDMLPRPPPMPSSSVHASVTKPTVPEVSMILEKSNEYNQNQNNIKPGQSYASWRKNILPRVTFPPNLKDESNMPSSSSATSATAPPSSLSNYIAKCPSVFPIAVAPSSGTYVNTYSTESSYSTPSGIRFEVGSQPVLSHGSKTPTISSFSQFTYKSEQRRSMDSLSQKNQPSENVLTISASTQTDYIGILDSTENHMKVELNQLVGVIRRLQEEQQQMRQIMEAFFLQQSMQQVPATLKVFCCDKSTQYDLDNGKNDSATAASHSTSQENLPLPNMDSGKLQHGLANVKVYSPTIKDTSRPVPPIAQSTTHRPNTPNNNTKQNRPTHNQYVQNMSALPTPSTERSLVMNELALKYLPSEKLTELLQDAQITPAPQRAMPLREIDNFNKAPTNISNASYKYLRKYRLLPDQNCNSPTQKALQSSPYQERVQDSPLACSNGSTAAETESPHLDLEHIRRQPKFL